VTDFGLAKRLEGDGGLTLTGAVMGTPQYMAPEQAAGKVRQLTTAADVYALGAILYHLLTGQPPFQGSSSVEILRQVLENDPRPPRALVPGLDQDLESICLKCLEKEPERRYGSAENLAEDLERWSRHEPVSARPITTVQRAVKWARRRPAIAGLAAAVVVVAVAGFAATLWQLRQANLARADAEQRAEAEARAHQESEKAKTAAQQSAEIAEAVNKFLTDDILARGNPGREVDGSLTVRQAVLEAAGKIQSRFTNQPLVEASIRYTVGDSLMMMGEWAQAPEHLEIALKLQRAGFGPDHADTLKTMHELSRAYRRVNRLDEALAVSQELLERTLKLKGEKAIKLVTIYGNHGSIYSMKGDLNRALELKLQGWQLSRELGLNEGFGDTVVATDIGGLYARQGKLDEAMDILEKSMSVQTKRRGSDYIYTLVTMRVLADLYARKGMTNQAYNLTREVMALSIKSLGESNVETILAMGAMVEQHKRRGEWDEAEALNRRTLELREKQMGAAHQATLQNLASLAGLLLRRGAYAEAEPLYKRYFELLPPKAEWNPGWIKDEWVVAWRNNFVDAVMHQGRLALAQKDFTTAETKLEEAWRLNQENQNLPRSKQIAGLFHQLYKTWNKPDKAVEWADKLPKPADP